MRRFRLTLECDDEGIIQTYTATAKVPDAISTALTPYDADRIALERAFDDIEFEYLNKNNI